MNFQTKRSTHGKNFFKEIKKIIFSKKLFFNMATEIMDEEGRIFAGTQLEM